MSMLQSVICPTPFVVKKKRASWAVRSVTVSTPSANVKDAGVINTFDRLSPSAVGTVNDPLMKSLVVNGPEGAMKSIPVNVYTTSALARGVHHIARRRTPGATADRSGLFRRKTDFLRIAGTDMGERLLLLRISIRGVGVPRIGGLKYQLHRWDQLRPDGINFKIIGTSSP
jgi:hypothetical protein